MNYTEDQFAALAPFEDNFRTAIDGEWTRRVRTPDQLRIKEIYEAATRSRIPFNQGCGTCLLNLLKRAGRLFFQDKTEREAAPATDKAAEAAKTPQISTQRAKKGNGTKTSNKGRKSAKK